MTVSPADDFIQTMGLLWHAEGGPRIAGQILGYLIIEGEPRTLQQMCDALKISKGSASTNARLLEGKGTLRRVHPVGARQDAWQAVPHPSQSILQTVAQRMRKNADVISDTSAAFPVGMEAARRRVEEFADFYRNSADFIDEWIERVGCRAAVRPEEEGRGHGDADRRGS